MTTAMQRPRRPHRPHLRRARRRRRHLRPDDRLRRGAARAVGRAHRARRLRQRRVVQPSPDDSRRPPLSADARHRRGRASRSASGGRSRESRRTRSGRCRSCCRSSRSLTRGELAMRAGFAARSPRRVRPESGRAAGTAGCPPAVLVSRRRRVQRFPSLDSAGLDRRGDLARLRQHRIRSAHAELRPGGVGARRGAGQLRRGHGAAARRRPRRRRPRRPTDRAARRVDIAARVTVNATGAGVNGWTGCDRWRRPIPLLKAMNLVTRREAGDVALGGAVAGRDAISSWCRGETARCSAPGSPTALSGRRSNDGGRERGRRRGVHRRDQPGLSVLAT